MNIKQYRTKYNMTVIRLSEILAISRQHVYDLESGNAFPSRKLAAKIEKKLNGEVTAKELLGV